MKVESYTKLKTLKKDFLYYVAHNLQRPSIIGVLPTISASMLLTYFTKTSHLYLYLLPLSAPIDLALLPITASVHGIRTLVNKIRRSYVETALQVLVGKKEQKRMNLSKGDFEVVKESARRLSKSIYI